MPMFSPEPDMVLQHSVLEQKTDRAACTDMLRGGSRTFFAASVLLPKRLRQPATALYAFCRVADDAVDDGARPAQALARLRDRLDRLYAGRPLPIAADRAAAEVVARFAVPKILFDALLDGFAWDAEGRRYRDLPALYAYAARVAGTVGAMMAVLMGAREADVVARACDLGMAMQLTNIARDVGEDARAGRLYLPADWLRQAGVDPDGFLRDPVFSPAIGSVVRRLLHAADDLYARADGGIAALPAACRPGIRAARFLYAEIGQEVRRQKCDSVSRRARVTGSRKAHILARALALPGPRRSIDAAATAEARFLVTAVTNSAAPRPVAPESRSLTETCIWVIDLFDRLHQRQQGIETGNP